MPARTCFRLGWSCTRDGHGAVGFYRQHRPEVHDAILNLTPVPAQKLNPAMPTMGICLKGTPFVSLTTTDCPVWFGRQIGAWCSGLVSCRTAFGRGEE